MEDSSEFVCRNCGSDQIVAWYRVWERQDVILSGDPDDIEVDYDGNTSSGEAEGDEESTPRSRWRRPLPAYRCRNCDAAVEVEVDAEGRILRGIEALVMPRAEFVAKLADAVEEKGPTRKEDA